MKCSVSVFVVSFIACRRERAIYLLLCSMRCYFMDLYSIRQIEWSGFMNIVYPYQSTYFVFDAFSLFYYIQYITYYCWCFIFIIIIIVSFSDVFSAYLIQYPVRHTLFVWCLFVLSFNVTDTVLKLNVNNSPKAWCSTHNTSHLTVSKHWMIRMLIVGIHCCNRLKFAFKFSLPSNAFRWTNFCFFINFIISIAYAWYFNLIGWTCRQRFFDEQNRIPNTQ